MAQFRTTADLKLEVLEKSGEVINGNSSYDSSVILYLNKAHQAIIGGGSIFSLKVDEPWAWAKSRHPIILELEAPFQTGNATVTTGERGVVLSAPPSTSLEGWHFKATGDRNTYKITEHTAASPNISLDANYVGGSGIKSFKIFKIDYEISPKFLVIDSYNDKLNFIETGTTELTITLVHGSYTPAELATHVASLLNSHVGTVNTYSGAFDPILKIFSFVSNLSGMGTVFKMLGATGTNKLRTALPVLGFDTLDYTGAASYISTYQVGNVSRLIEPFKSFQRCADPFIYGSDPQDMENKFPLADIREQVPTHFTKIFEDSNGNITVRFNTYAMNAMKIEIDWIPVPHDLQNNAASIPRIPRKDIDVLIHAACMFILYDKNSPKFQVMLDITRSALEAMEKKNRSEMFRVGQYFGQIVPRQDYVNRRSHLRYGYPVSGDGQPNQVSDGTSNVVMTKVTMNYTSFQIGALTISPTAKNLAANRSLVALIIKHTTSFGGGAISSLLIDVGIAGDTQRFISGFDVMQAVAPGAQASNLTVFFPAVETPILVTATAVGANLSELTQGSLDLFFHELTVD